MPTSESEEAKYTIEFYEEEGGNVPVLRWLKEELSPVVRRLLGAALNEILAYEGSNVCDGEFGKQLGEGLFEFRVNGDPQAQIDEGRKRRGKQPKKVDPPAEKVLLRVFCHAHGSKVILLLGAYDKANDPSRKRQEKEISDARKRLEAWKTAKIKATAARKKGAKRRTN
jgi:hypothetical protein